MKNYSRQREAILLELRSRYDHPTASQVYDGVRKKIPNISLGTVYRNLSALTQSGDILSISVGDGHEHFDGNRDFHLHLHCKGCGNITDVPAPESEFKALTKYDDFTPATSICIVYGFCKNCNQQLSK